MNYSYDGLIKIIHDVFGETVDSTHGYKERLCELDHIFSAQLSSLRRIRELGFFETLTNSFWKAIEVYLELAQSARNNERFEELIHDSYIFIKSFDNALQGYLNSDRLFLEFPGHSVSLYDLPAKLGVVYVRFIEMIIASLKGEDDDVAFLLCPEPFEEEGIHVMRLLYSNESTSKEMLVIEAPRNLMFEPDSFLFALAHEIAHYVGRHHRLLDGSEKPRNTMLYELHEEEFVEKCKEGLCLALEESFDYTTATRISNLFKEKIEAENSNYKRRIKKNASPPDEKASFTEMEKYIFENYTNPLLRETDKRICEVLIPGILGDHRLEEREQATFMNTVRIRMSEYAVSLLIDASEAALYITKEGAADAAAIKLLGLSCNEYISKILAEHRRIINNRNLKNYLLMRGSLVCSACFKEEYKLMYKQAEINGTTSTEVLPYEEKMFEGKEYSEVEELISENGDRLIMDYIRSIYEAVNENEKLKQLYYSRKKDLSPYALFSGYML